METTRDRSDGETIPESSENALDETLWNPRRFILLRFAAVLAVALALLLARNAFHITRIDYTWLWALDGVLLLSNLAYFFFLRSRPDQTVEIWDGASNFERFFAIQITADLLIFTLMLHFSGGAANPFFLLYLLPVIASALLLSKRMAYYFTGFASVLFAGLVLLEGTGAIRHYRLFPSNFHTDHNYMTGVIIAFVSILFISAWLIIELTGRLRRYRFQSLHAVEDKCRIEMEKAHFLDVVAHDLRSPLSTIETMVTSLLEAYGSEMNEDTRDTLERIPKRTRDLIRFIQNLLDFSRIRTQDEMRSHFKPLNFLPIVTSTVEMYMDQALDKKITMTVQVERNIPLLMGSGEHLERMVANLISNAIRYTPENGSVKVKLGVEDNSIVLTVADSGIGIPEADLPKIFTEFYRTANARRMTSSGTGLGLAITRFIVEKHDGDIQVNSEEGEGTIFTVRLPVYEKANA